jgi:hypothetical protein
LSFKKGLFLPSTLLEAPTLPFTFRKLADLFDNIFNLLPI